LLGLGRFFSFLVYMQSAGLLGREISRRKAATYTQNKRTQTSTSRLGFEPTTPVFERAKTVHALDSVTNVVGPIIDLSEAILNYISRAKYD
jgi:hypothetical protein